MKKTISILLVLCSLFTILATVGCASESETGNMADSTTSIILQIGNPMMRVNGEEKPIDADGTAPIIQNERTLLPVRAVVEEMGGTVEWNNETKEVTLNYESDEIILTIDSQIAYLNEAAQTLDAEPTIINNRTMLPIRFIAEGFNFSVEWNQEEQLVTITKIVTKTSATTVPPDPTVAPTSVPTADPTTDDEKTLVLYFTNTGNTKALAEKIHAVTGGDIEEILPITPYTSDDLNYNDNDSRANQEINSDARPEIQALNANVEQYDTIIIGYPIWWGECPPAVRSFLDSFDLSGKTIMPFCTSGSSGIGGSLAKIRELSPNSTITEGFRGTGSTTDVQINTWLEDNGFVK